MTRRGQRGRSSSESRLIQSIQLVIHLDVTHETLNGFETFKGNVSSPLFILQGEADGPRRGLPDHTPGGGQGGGTDAQTGLLAGLSGNRSSAPLEEERTQMCL